MWETKFQLKVHNSDCNHCRLEELLNPKCASLKKYTNFVRNKQDPVALRLGGRMEGLGVMNSIDFTWQKNAK